MCVGCACGRKGCLATGWWEQPWGLQWCHSESREGFVCVCVFAHACVCVSDGWRMAGRTLSRVQHHLTQVTCCAALVGHRYATQHSRVSLCVCVCIWASINKGSMCTHANVCDPVCVCARKKQESCDVWAWWRWGLPSQISVTLHHFLLSWCMTSFCLYYVCVCVWHHVPVLLV